MTDAVQLCEPDVAHRDMLIRLFTDRAVRQFLGGPIDVDVAIERVDTLLESPPSNYWVICFNHQPVGTVCIGSHCDLTLPELSFLLLPEFQNKNIGYRACQQALGYIKGVIVAETQLKNRAAQRLLTKLGFTIKSSLIRFSEQQGLYFRE
jgi:RimJ/RimL family protein N-acetyltransferase